MSRREEFLAVVNNKNIKEFVDFVKLHNSRNDVLDLNDVIQCLSRQQYNNVWVKLHEICTSVLMSFDVDNENDEAMEDDQQTQNMQQSSEVLHGIVVIAMCAINVEKPVITPMLLQVAVMLHGILLSLPEDCSKLQYQIAHLCETWFHSNLDGKNELITSTIPYFIIRSLSQGIIVDVQRLWNLRQGLLLIDFDDETSFSLKSLFQQCLVQPLYLRLDEGRRFLSYLFGLHPKFIDDLHKTIKNQIPFCPIASLSFYGEVYFKAWRAAKDVYLQKIEVNCIQDLMFHAIHARCNGKSSMASRLKKVLGYFHQHKKSPDVDKMLLKLYEPIIWRACKVANPSVRENAAAILFDVFPLRDPDDNITQSDQLLQRQFDIINSFLDDPSPAVRATTVYGIFRITSLFWELIPVHVVKDLITKIFHNAAYDISSMLVRLAVFKGILFVLDNRLCHPLLKTLLPSLKNLLHDNSEKVRLAFLSVLLKIKGMKYIKFWTITPMEHLLGRLDVEQSSSVIRRLVLLLMNSFHPTNKDNEELLTRCAGLWNSNPKAARKFYQYAHLQMSLSSSVKFLLLLSNYGSYHSKKMKNNNDEEENDDATPDLVDQEDGSVTTVEDKCPTSPNDVTDVNLQTIAGFLETCAIIWEGIKDQLDKPVHRNLKKKVIDQFSKSVPILLQSIQEARCQSALTLISAHLPSSDIPKLSKSFLSTLHSLDDDASDDVYGPLLECLCSWKKTNDILELINDRLRNTLQPTAVKQSNRKRKTINFNLPLTKSQISLNFLDWMMASQSCRTYVFEVGEHFDSLTETLSTSMNSIEEYLKDNNDKDEKGKFLKNSFSTYCRLKIHLYEKKILNASDDVMKACHQQLITSFDHNLSWCERVLLPYLDNECSESEDEEVAPEAKRDQTFEQLLSNNFAFTVLKDFLRLLCELVILGVNKCCLNVSVARMMSSMTKHERSIYLLPEVSKLMYQIAQEITNTNENGLDISPLKDIFSNIIAAASTLECPNKIQILTSIKPALIEVIKMSYQNRIFEAENLDNAITMNIIDCVIKETCFLLKENPITKDKDDLPVTSQFLLNIVLTSKYLIRATFLGIRESIKSDVFKDIEYQAVSFLIWIFINENKTTDEMKLCLSEIEKALERTSQNKDEEPQYLTETKRLIQECYTYINEVASIS